MDDGDCPDGERDANAQRNDHDIALGVAASLEVLIPPIEQFHDRPAEADGNDGGDRESSKHVNAV